MKLFFLLALIFSCSSDALQAAYYETLPKGVRLLAYRRVQTASVTAQFNETGQKQELGFRQSLKSEDIKDIKGVDLYLEELKALSPEAYDALNLGRYEIEAQADVLVHGVGFAWGLSDRLTAFASLPIYKARVNMNVNRTQGHNYNQVADLLSSASNKSDSALLMEQLTRQLPDASGPLLQSVLVNQYGYKPLGSWNGQGMGDLTLATLYRLTDWSEGGLATSFGVVLPTGRIDDPDTLQDFGFGDGQTDLFLEFGGGVLLLDRKFELDSVFRYTYQMSSEKSLRIPDSPSIPLSSEKGLFQEKLGNQFELRIQGKYHTSLWTNLILGYDYFLQQESRYDSSYLAANDFLSQDSERSEHRAIAGVNLTSVEAFKNNKFPMPFNLNFTVLRTISGTNTPELTRFDLELRLFF